MKKLIKTLTLTAAGLVVGAVVLKRVRSKKEITNALEVIQNLDLIEYKRYPKIQ